MCTPGKEPIISMPWFVGGRATVCHLLGVSVCSLSSIMSSHYLSTISQITQTCLQPAAFLGSPAPV